MASTFTMHLPVMSAITKLETSQEHHEERRQVQETDRPTVAIESEMMAV
jgi:hypothetical protein